MEEIFESRKFVDMKRPQIKDSVLESLHRCEARDSLLVNLRMQGLEIDKFLEKTRQK